MKKSLSAIPTAVLIGLAGLGAAAAVTTDEAAQPAPQATAEAGAQAQKDELTEAQLKKQKEAKKVERIASTAGISKKDVKTYNIGSTP